MAAMRRRAYRLGMPSPTPLPTARARRPDAHEPPSFKQPRENEQLADSQHRAAQGRAAARHDALVMTWLRALART
jgi:hypothetical protein